MSILFVPVPALSYLMGFAISHAGHSGAPAWLIPIAVNAALVVAWAFLLRWATNRRL